MMLACASSSVADARHRLAEDLHRLRVRRGGVDDAVLVLSELVSNAIKHARPLESGEIAVVWEITGELVRVAVTDGGSSTRPVPIRPSRSALGGRGLGIVSMLANEWGVDYAPAGRTVWAVLHLAGRRSRAARRAAI